MYVLYPRPESVSQPGLRDRWSLPDLRESLLWRSRWVIVALLAAPLLAVAFARATGAGAGPGEGAVRYETVTVQQGDTLWTIASRRYPDADPREKVGEIEQANGLGGPTIEAGQRLRLPVR
jgi:hypothetical protein